MYGNNASGTSYYCNFTYGALPATTPTLTSYAGTANMRITYGTDELLDYCSEAHNGTYASDISANWSSNYSAYSQSFQTPNDGLTRKLSSIKLYLRNKYAGQTGTIRVDVYAHTGSFGSSSVPTGAVLASSDALDISAFSTSVYEFKTLAFSGANRIMLAANTAYVFVVKGISISGGAYVQVAKVTATGVYHPGNECYYGGSWSPESANDLIFYLYTTVGATTRTITATGQARGKGPRTITISGGGFGLSPLIFEETWENNNWNNWTGSSGSTWSISNTVQRRGSYAAKLQTAGSVNAYYYKDTGSSSAAKNLRVYVKFTDTPSTGNRYDVLWAVNNTGPNPLFITCLKNVAGVLKWTLFVYSGGWQEYNSGAVTIDTNHWYCVEMHTEVAASAVCKLYVDETAVATSGTLNTGGANNQYVEIGGSINQATTIYFDDFAASLYYIGPNNKFPRTITITGQGSGVASAPGTVTDTIGSMETQNNWTVGYVTAQRVQASATGTLQILGYNGQAGSGQIKLALYSDSGGNPANLLAYTNPATFATGWHDLAVVTGVTITAGTYYWICFTKSATDIALYTNNAGGNTPYYALSWGSAFLASTSWTAGSYKESNVRMTYTNGTETVIDSYSETNVDTGDSWMNSNGIFPAGTGGNCVCQSFTVGASAAYLTRAKFMLSKQGSPAGTLKAALFTHSGVMGTSSQPANTTPLATSTNSLDMATVSGTKNLFEFIFDGTYQLQASTNYCIGVYVATRTTLDSSNTIFVNRDNSSPSHAGNSCYCSASTWSVENTKDTIFYVYGTAAGGGSPPGGSALPVIQIYYLKRRNL